MNSTQVASIPQHVNNLPIASRVAKVRIVMVHGCQKRGRPFAAVKDLAALCGLKLDIWEASLSTCAVGANKRKDLEIISYIKMGYCVKRVAAYLGVDELLPAVCSDCCECYTQGIPYL